MASLNYLQLTNLGETLKVDGAQSLYRRGIEIQPHNKIPSYDWSSKL